MLSVMVHIFSENLKDSANVTWIYGNYVIRKLIYIYLN